MRFDLKALCVTLQTIEIGVYFHLLVKLNLKVDRLSMRSATQQPPSH